MALNLGLRFYTPEEYFRDEPTDPNFTLRGWNPATHDHTREFSLLGSRR